MYRWPSLLFSWYMPAASADIRIKILLVGHGFVGKVIEKSLKSAGYNVAVVDKKKGSIKKHKDADCVIIAVDTPTINGKCDDSNIIDVLYEIGKYFKEPIPIMIKSTVTPDLVTKYPRCTVICPEFLREIDADNDFENQQELILGGEDTQCMFWKNIFSYLDAEAVFVSREAASLIKYIHNTWLATKVVFFHDLYQYALDEPDAAFNVKNLVEATDYFASHDIYVGPSHMKAPNAEGELGYSGKCFPKDVEAFSNLTENNILNTIMYTNKDLK